MDAGRSSSDSFIGGCYVCASEPPGGLPLLPTKPSPGPDRLNQPPVSSAALDPGSCQNFLQLPPDSTDPLVIGFRHGSRTNGSVPGSGRRLVDARPLRH